MVKEITVSKAAARATFGLIMEYFHQGGAGHDEEGLEEFMEALLTANHIIIEGE
jgi:hypothetical protein